MRVLVHRSPVPAPRMMVMRQPEDEEEPPLSDLYSDAIEDAKEHLDNADEKMGEAIEELGAAASALDRTENSRLESIADDIRRGPKANLELAQRSDTEWLGHDMVNLETVKKALDEIDDE